MTSKQTFVLEPLITKEFVDTLELAHSAETEAQARGLALSAALEYFANLHPELEAKGLFAPLRRTRDDLLDSQLRPLLRDPETADRPVLPIHERTIRAASLAAIDVLTEHVGGKSNARKHVAKALNKAGYEIRPGTPVTAASLKNMHANWFNKQTAPHAVNGNISGATDQRLREMYRDLFKRDFGVKVSPVSAICDLLVNLVVNGRQKPEQVG